MITKANPILPSKLYIPPFKKEFVSRARLLKQLNAGLARKLTLVSAPAGYGKSTTISEWVGQAGKPVAWLSLDKSDNDPSRFWSYFVAALRTIPGLEDVWVGGDIFDPRQTPSIPDNETFLANLIIAIISISERFVLILDDLQAITEAGILDDLFFLLENLPPGPKGMHLVIASRSDPPWPLARLRANNEITEIRVRELCFTIDETAAFLNDVMGLTLSAGEIVELDQHTEGWIAGLQLAAISMQGREDFSGFLDAFTGSHRFVLDYLIEEVLSRQTPEILDFLVKTSILERMTEGLCDAVTGNCNGENILLQLERANLFLVALDDQRTWYRYHNLFADLLQKQLRTRYSEQIATLHRQASQWYAQAGSAREAVAHALNTDDWDFAAAQVEEFVLDLIQHGEMTLLQHWMCSLPEEKIRQSPILCVAQAWAAAQYASVELAEDLLAQAEAALENEPSGNGHFDPQVYKMISGQIAVLQVVIARLRGDSTHRQQALVQEALDQLPADDAASRATLFLRLGFSYLDLGKDEEADRTFSQAYRLGQSGSNYYAAHVANYGRMVIARRHGNLHELAAICRQTLDASTAYDEQQRSLNGFAHIMSGSLYYEWNNLDEAERLLVQGIDLVEQAGMAELLIKGHYTMACLNAARGKTEPLPELREIAKNGHPGLTHYAASLRVRLHLLSTPQSKNTQFTAETTQWAEAQQLDFRGRPAYDWEMREKLIYARVLCRQYESQPSSRLKAGLEQVLDFIQGQCHPLDELNWWGTLVEVYIVIALIMHNLERKAEALTALKQALDFAETQGFLRAFLDEGQPMRALLHLALADGKHKEYSREILAAFDSQTPSSRSITPHQPDNLTESLSAREMQVLRLLNTRLSVPEIAEEIHLAPTTVRTHVQHIYQKLGVHGRIEALQRAEKLGLF